MQRLKKCIVGNKSTALSVFFFSSCWIILTQIYKLIIYNNITLLIISEPFCPRDVLLQEKLRGTVHLPVHGQVDSKVFSH